MLRRSLLYSACSLCCSRRAKLKRVFGRGQRSRSINKKDSLNRHFPSSAGGTTSQEKSLIVPGAFLSTIPRACPG